MPIVDYPYFAHRPEFKGLFVGGCVERGDGSSFRRRAHAHTWTKNKWLGWICVRSAKRLGNGKPSMLMLHELAHLLVGDNHGHDDVWRAKVREIGGKVFWHETKEYNRLHRAGWYVRKKIGKRRVKKLLASPQ